MHRLHLSFWPVKHCILSSRYSQQGNLVYWYVYRVPESNTSPPETSPNRIMLQAGVNFNAPNFTEKKEEISCTNIYSPWLQSPNVVYERPIKAHMTTPFASAMFHRSDRGAIHVNVALEVGAIVYLALEKLWTQWALHYEFDLGIIGVEFIVGLPLPVSCAHVYPEQISLDM